MSSNHPTAVWLFEVLMTLVTICGGLILVLAPPSKAIERLCLTVQFCFHSCSSFQPSAQPCCDSLHYMSPNPPQQGRRLWGMGVRLLVEAEEGEGWERKHSRSVITRAIGPPKQKKLHSCDEIRVNPVKHGASFAIWTQHFWLSRRPVIELQFRCPFIYNVCVVWWKVQDKIM